MSVVMSPGQGAALYDVELRRRPPQALLSRFPSVSVRTTGAQTALRRLVDGPAQMGALLRDLVSLGLVLTDVHRLPPRPGPHPADPGAATEPGRPAVNPAAPAMYEIRVAGELGAALLNHLQCAHYDVPQQSVVRLSVAAGRLNEFLQECTDCGSRIERVRRVIA
jgi:hypothetical protein